MFGGLVFDRSRQWAVAPLSFLVLAVLSAMLLGWEAWRARTQQRLATERALSEYATFSSAQFVDRAVRALIDALATVYDLPAAPPARRSPETFVAAPVRPERAPMAWCRCLTAVEAYFVVPFDAAGKATASASAVGGAISPVVQRWITAAAEARGRAFGAALASIRAIDPSASVADASVPPSARSLIPEVGWYFPRLEGRNLAIVFGIAVDADGAPYGAFGLITAPSSLLPPLVQRLLRGQGLLPAAVVRGLPNDSVVVVRLADDEGRVAYSSVTARPSRYGLSDYAITDTLSRQPGSLRFQIALRQDIVPRLAVPGSSDIRLGVVLGLLVVSLAGVFFAARRLRRASALAEAREAFVSGVSHELRTPLTQIRLFAELLQDPVIRSDVDRLRWAGIIDQEARRLGFLVENVLCFARGERNGLRVTPVACDAEEILGDVLEAFAPLAAVRRVTIEPRIAQDLPTLWADPTALRHILLNLLDNAVKYGPEGQRLVVTFAPTRDGGVQLMVDDEGPGVPAADRQRIWEAYHRLERDRAAGGSGIGLAVVRELVQRHGGTVQVVDAPARGARFIVEFAAAPPSDARPTLDAP